MDAHGKRDPAEEFILDRHIAHLIRVAHQRASSRFQKMLGESGLTPTQFAVIGTLGRLPALPQNELGRITAIDPATLSSMLRRLEKSGLLLRAPSPRDHRFQLVDLTEAGRELAVRMTPVSMRLSGSLLDPIPEGERQRFVELLRLMGDAEAETPE